MGCCCSAFHATPSPITCGGISPTSYTCYYTHNNCCGCNHNNTGCFGFGGNSLALIALYSLLCR